MSMPQDLTSLSLPRRVRLKLTFLNYVTDFVRRSDVTVNRTLMNFLERRMSVSPSPTPYRGVSTHDITLNHLTLRLFIPHTTTATTTSSTTSDTTASSATSAAAKLPVMVFFHGGGFVFLSAFFNLYDLVCRRFARKLNAVIVSVEYRLAPEHKFPSQFDDGFEVLKFLDDSVGGLKKKVPFWPENADVGKCFIAGDSAGGNIAHNVSVMASRTAFSHLRVVGLINIQPFFGGKNRANSEVRLDGAPIVSIARTEWMWKAFLPEGLDLDHWSVNVSGPNALNLSVLEKFPATLLFVGGFDPLQDWQMKYSELLKKQGKEVKVVEYPTAIHAFYVFPDLKEGSLLFDEVKNFVEERCSKVQ